MRISLIHKEKDMCFLTDLPVEKWFLILASTLGLVFILLTPPFQVPDEPNHFYRAFQVAEGGIRSTKKDQRVGGYLPSSLKKFVEPYHRLIAGEKFTRDTILKYSAGIRLNEKERAFIDFNNTALYSPVCYLPQAIGIWLFKPFDPPVIVLFYAARVFALAFWIALIFFAIRILPVCKWGLFLFCLLPTSLSINSSVSADCVTNAVSFLFIALMLQQYFSMTPVSTWKLIVIIFLALILPLTKSPYAPLVLLFLIIKPSKFGSPKKAALVYILFFLVPVISFLLWEPVMSELLLTYKEYNPAYRDHVALVSSADFHSQLDILKNDPGFFFQMLRHSIEQVPFYHVPGLVASFGWGDLILPAWFTYGAYIVLLLITVTDSTTGLVFTWRSRIFMVFIVLITLSAVFTSQFLTWTAIGANRVNFIQGRYLTPFYPLVLLLFGGIIKPGNINHKVVCCISAVAFSIISFIYLYNRYF
jgi:uncharacterized membrane protein